MEETKPNPWIERVVGLLQLSQLPNLSKARFDKHSRNGASPRQASKTAESRAAHACLPWLPWYGLWRAGSCEDRGCDPESRCFSRTESAGCIVASTLLRTRCRYATRKASCPWPVLCRCLTCSCESLLASHRPSTEPRTLGKPSTDAATAPGGRRLGSSALDRFSGSTTRKPGESRCARLARVLPCAWKGHCHWRKGRGVSQWKHGTRWSLPSAGSTRAYQSSTRTYCAALSPS